MPYFEMFSFVTPIFCSGKIKTSGTIVFDLISRTGHIPERDMFNTFNMGVGMVVCVDKNDVDKTLASLKASGEEAYVLGELVNSDEGVILC